MSFKVIAVALTLIGTHASGMGQTLEKNGLPCVAELCIGDGITELSKIQWTPSHTSYKVNNKVQLTSEKKLTDDDLRVLKSTYPVAGEAAPFLHERIFDASALPVLARDAREVAPHALTAVTNDERAAISKLLTRSYGKFGAGNRTVPDRPGEGRFFPSGMAKFGFGLSLFRGADESVRLMTHPACSNGDKVKSS